MTDDSSKFLTKSIEEIKLSNEETRLAKLEQLSFDIDPSLMPSGQSTCTKPQKFMTHHNTLLILTNLVGPKSFILLGMFSNLFTKSRFL